MSMIERPKDEEVRTDSESVCSRDAEKDHVKEFQNSDRFLKKEAARIMKEREKWGLEGLVGGLEAIIINVETEHQERAIQELLDFTGYDINTSFENENLITAVLKLEESADILVTSRKQENNPYRKFNIGPISKRLPNTRLETFIFRTSDIKKYYDIQRQRGVEFINDGIVTNDTHKLLITEPSRFTGVSVGLIEWLEDSRSYRNKSDKAIDFDVKKPQRDYLKNITYLDHTATRVRALDRDAAIIEFMELTNYKFDFAIYVRLFNSITNVARLSAKDFAMVFTLCQ